MSTQVTPGVFRPAVPREHDEVIRLFAIAARAACAKPDHLAELTKTLEEVTRELLRPEIMTAQECHKLWQAFARTVPSLPPDKWFIAGKALLRDLESLAQRLDLMPLPSWSKLPEGLEHLRARAPVAQVVSGEGAAVQSFLAQAQNELSGPHADDYARAEHVHRLLHELAGDARARLFGELVASQSLTKGESVMLTRVFAKDVALTPEDENIVEVLSRLAGVLAQRR